MMVREKVPIKKIDNATARRVTFSNDKLFHYSSSSMEEVLERRSLHSKNLEKLNQPSLELQLVEDTNYANLSKEVAERTLHLRRLRGEELQGLSIEELHQLEKSLEAGLSRVVAKKGEVIMNEINHLQEKEVNLMGENDKLRQELLKISNARKQIICDSGDDRESSVSTDICNSAGTPQDYESSGTSLKLGLPNSRW
ncbi:putative transcription factor MADS-MIKC family [Helianthus annuus]|nr:putative transcription factor MADS-MIKC family [Helianthus annuus]KAJ0562950.1 putative transcription factor MADS-MIKC family [Helianthus annuus]KAJ0728315.1 putative transcription factor MADS-MIKC family [Helianthus annuus]